MACYAATSHVIWLRKFVSPLEIVDSISRPLKLYCDNSAAISFSKNTTSSSCSKYIDIKFYFIKEKVAKGLITIEYMPTGSMLADPLTKDLLICVF